jgi:hypothetical protein
MAFLFSASVELRLATIFWATPSVATAGNVSFDECRPYERAFIPFFEQMLHINLIFLTAKQRYAATTIFFRKEST